MDQIIAYARHLNANDFVITWIERVIGKYLKKNAVEIEEIEHIIDFLISPAAPRRISRMSYLEARASAERWNKTLQKKGTSINESKTDTQIILDFKDGFKFVKLIGKAAYEREGYFMRHCVASYFDRDLEIFSLRDKQNMPHCTIEKDKQIKGKGNGDISPKYIDYVVRFLEHTGMNVRDSEMAHLGYETVKFGEYAKTKLYRDRYKPKGANIEYRDDVTIVHTRQEASEYDGNGVLLLDGYIDVREGATLTVPDLKEVSGYIDVRKG
ncbi:MAG: PcfJ domain-containing protein, partial [Methanogenium sp.]